MEKCYKLQMMTPQDLCNYLGGGWNYAVKTEKVMAATPEQAIAKARLLFPNMEINSYVVECEPDHAFVDQMTMVDYMPEV